MDHSASNEARGAAAGLVGAALFGLSAPLAKLLLPSCGPIILAALLYLGGGLGLTLVMALRRLRGSATREPPPSMRDVPLLLAITVLGGGLGPVLMLLGLGRVSGVVGSLLLTLEGPFTVLLALSVFGEHLGARAVRASLLVFVGAMALTLRPEPLRADLWGACTIAGASLCWALDNNLTQRLSLKDPLATVRIKALGAGAGMLVLARLTHQEAPPSRELIASLVLGSGAYGLSIVLDMYALRWVGAAREAAYFATAPFLGALASVPLLGESLGLAELVGGAILATGVALLLRARHAHGHAHEVLEHEHLHVHDAHHQHAHEGPVLEPHSHKHRHEPLVHDHPHVSDLHHRHSHH